MIFLRGKGIIIAKKDIEEATQKAANRIVNFIFS